MDKNCEITPTDLTVLRERLVEGLTLHAIATRHNVTRQRIHQRLSKKFSVVSNGWRKPVVLDPELVRRYLPEWSESNAANQNGVI